MGAKLKWLLILLSASAAAFSVVGLVLPARFDIARSIEIRDHPIKVHLQVGELRSWSEWWPWRDIDKTVKFSFGPQTSGVGATATLRGRPAAGRLRLTEASPVAGIGFEYTLEGNARADRGAFEYRYRPDTRGTVLIWRVRGHFETPVLAGYLALLADSMHGGMLEWGLANIKRLVEADPREIISGDPIVPAPSR